MPPKLGKAQTQAIENMAQKKKTTAKKLSAKSLKQSAKKALDKAKWVEKQAPAVEKKAVAEIEKAMEEMCVEDSLEEVVGMLGKAKPAKAAIKPKMAMVQKAKKSVKKAAEKLPPPTAKAVEKELGSSFEAALKFWKDLEAEAKKQGLEG